MRFGRISLVPDEFERLSRKEPTKQPTAKLELRHTAPDTAGHYTISDQNRSIMEISIILEIFVRKWISTRGNKIVGQFRRLWRKMPTTCCSLVICSQRIHGQWEFHAWHGYCSKNHVVNKPRHLKQEVALCSHESTKNFLN